MRDRAILITAEMAEAIRLGAEFCGKLSAIEHAHLTGDEENVDLLLSGVDPIDARLAANLLTSLWQVWEILSREDRGRSTEGVSPVIAPPTTPAAYDDGHEQATAPIPFPGYSLRCS